MICKIVNNMNTNMNTSLVITTINSPNKAINLFSKGCKKNNWNFIIIGDKKTPKNFLLKYGNFISLRKQKTLTFKFSKNCPINNYSRKNIGYLLSFKNGSDFIVESDDDNIPKNLFFNKINLSHKTESIKNKNWINIYDLFLKKKKQNLIWPRGIPLEEISKNKIKIIKKKKKFDFFLQQGVCEGNPDVDAIYRLINRKIEIRFKNYKINLNKSYSTFNSQNTIWHKSLAPLMYLPVTCSMRCTDILRSLIALRILQINDLKVLFFGTNMFQKRNSHNLLSDFEQEIQMYLKNGHIFDILKNINLKKGRQFFLYNLEKCYKKLVEKKIFIKKELFFLKAWIKDLKNIYRY